MYDPAFYDMIRSGTQASAAALVPRLVALFNPTSVVDVGCGEGWWAEAFVDMGIEDAWGVDGEYVQSSPLSDRFHARDLSQPLDLGRTFDLAISLEVAEHLPPQRADGFVSDLCHLAPTVVFSAAIPGQGGVGHVNEQWPRFWASKFEAHGYTVTGALRLYIWDDDRIENWYRQNLLVAARRPRPSWLFKGPLTEPFPLVHPVLFDHIRSVRR